MSLAAAKFLPGTDATNVVSTNTTKVTASSDLQLVYYRVYHRDGAIATKRPAYLNDIYLGRIKSKWVAPPHTAGSLRHCLSSMENIDPTETKLFATVSSASESALADEEPISLKSHQTLGIVPEAPVMLFSETIPEAGMQAGSESLCVAPDSESPLAPRFLFYGVYSETGVWASKAPIDAEEPWVSKINLDSIPPPVSVTSLLHILKMKEGIKTFSCQLFAQDDPNPLGDSPIVTEDGNWLGASAEEHLVLKFASRPPLAEGVQYWIQNCYTDNLLGVQNLCSNIRKNLNDGFLAIKPN